MLRKLCLREIRGSLGRFLAIAAIIALGVGFFAGLRVSKRAMVETGGQYLEDFALYDFRLLSTLGFTGEDVEAIGALPGVRAARGSVSQDVLYENGSGADSVAAMHTLLPDVNVPDLRAGRMPLAPDECVVDATAFRTDAIGTQLRLSPANDADTLELFSFGAYTVVGLVDSPAYINFERGGTGLGSGSVACYAYLLPEGFDADYFTELYLTLGETAPIYSEAYDDLIDGSRPAVEDLLALRAELRYDDLREDGERELRDARAELAQAKADYADGKRVADEKLADAQAELEDARRELDDGWLDYRDGQQELDDEVSKAQAEIADGQKELDDALAELEDGEQTYLDSCRELEDGEADYADGLRTYRDGLAGFEDGKVRYERGLADYQEGLDRYQKGLKEYEDGYADYRAGRSSYIDGRNQYNEQRAAFDALGLDIEAIRESVAQNKDLVEASRGPLMELLTAIVGQLQNPAVADADALAAALRNDPDGALTAAVDGILQAMQAVNPGVPEDTEALLAAYTMLQQYDQGVEALDAYAQLEDARVGLEAASGELSDAWKQLKEARQELDEAKDELIDAKHGLEDARLQMDDGWTELEDGRLELEDARAELDDGWRQYRDARAELDDSWAAYRDGSLELEDARRKLDDETAKARRKLDDALAELEDGEQTYRDGLAEYENARRDAEEELADAAQKIADGEAELADGEETLSELKPADCYTLGREANVGYVCFENDTDIVAAVSGVFPLFFFLVAALVCITTMTRMVDDERTKIGVLKALGYFDGAIMAKYLAYAGSASLLGCAVGFLAGSWAFPMVMWKVYDIMYSFSYPIRFVLDWRLAAFSIGLYLLCALGSTWLVCRASLHEVAAELIRPKAPKSGKRILLERLPFLWNRMKFLHKVSARNILRYKKRFFMMVLGIGGCTALLLTGFGIRDSIANVVDFQFDEISRFDSAVTFQDPMSEAEQAAFLSDCAQWVDRAVFFHGGSIDAVRGKVTKSVNLVVSGDAMTGFMEFHSGGAPVAYPGSGEALINNGLADALGLKVGDELLLRDGDMNTLQVRISGIFENYIYNYVFVTPETVEAQWGATPEIKSAYLVDRAGVDPHAAGAAVIDQDTVTSVSINADMRARVNAMLKSLDYIVLLVIVCAGSLAFIVLYNLTNINITERIREIATIKVLGFYANETGAYVFRENTVLTAVGALAGILLGRLLHAYVMSQIRIDMMHFDVRVAWPSYLFAFALTFAFAAIVNFVMFFKLEQINMAESLKSTE